MIFSEKLIENNPYNQIYGLSRTLLALSTFITLLFNSTNIIFDEQLFNLYSNITYKNYLNINLFFLIGFDNLLISKILSLLILSLVIIGIYPRITGVFHFWVAYSFLNASAIIEGGDQINLILTFLYIPITLLDKRKNHWNNNIKNSLIINIIGNSILFIIYIQISILYLHAGIEKIYKLDQWVEGSSIYYILNNGLFGIPKWFNFILKLINIPIVSFFISWSIIILEILLFCSIFMNKKNKKILFIIGIFFHFLIAILFGLISFFFSMAGALVIYLMPLNFSIKNSNIFIHFRRYLSS